MSDGDRETARQLVLRHGWNPAAYQILNRGMQRWFSARGDAVIGYATYRRTRVVAGAPVVDPARLAAVVDEFTRATQQAGDRVVYFGAGPRLERLFTVRRSHHLACFGAQPVWDARDWPEIVTHKASLRAQLNRARNKGVTVSEHASNDPALRAELRNVLRQWLASRGLPALHFMTEPDLLDDLRDRRVFVALHRGSIVAFLLATPVPARQGWLVEQWPRTPQAPNGTMQLLVDAAMRSFAASGDRFVTLGLAPLSDHACRMGEGEPAWLRLTLRWLRAHGRRFYNFRGLDAFKAALEPRFWEPIYVIVPERITPPLLWAITGVFSGGTPVEFLARALGSAMMRELGMRD